MDYGELLDEGPVHALYVAMFGTVETRASRFLLRRTIGVLAGVVNCYIFMRVPKDECIANFSSGVRTSARFNPGSSEAQISLFRTDLSYNNILEAIDAAVPDRIHFVESAAEAAALCQEIANLPDNGSGRR